MQPGVGKTARGGARSALAAQLSVQLGSMTATVIMARILAPAEFGIVALAQSLLGIASLVGLAGITAAIVTTREDSRRKAATYFWAALIVGTVFSLVLSVLAVPLVRVLGQPNAAPYVTLLTLSLPLSLLTLVPQALLQRRLQFARMNVVTVTGASAYFILEVLLALAGWGAWAVILGQVIGSAISLVAALVLAKWIPRSRPRLSEVREDLGLISNMGIGSFLTYLGKNSDYWAVSGILGAAPLGVYYIAYVLPSIIRVRLSGIFRQIMLPILAGLVDPMEQSRVWSRATTSSFTLALPVLFGVAALANPLVRVVFGEQWAGAVRPMQLVTLASVTDMAIHAVSTMAIALRQRVTTTTAIVGLRAVLIGAGSLVAAATTGSLVAVAGVVLAASLVTLVVQDVVLARPLGIGVRALGNDLPRVLLVCALMLVVVESALRTVLSSIAPQWQLLAGFGLGSALYLVIGLLIARAPVLESVRQARQIVSGR